MNLGLLGLNDGIQFKWYEQLFVGAINKLAETPQKVDMLDINKQEFLKTFIVLFQSIRLLCLALKIESSGKETPISALPAIMTLVRACFENYSIFYFIYLENKDKETIRFRFWSWWREGLMRRQKYKALGRQYEQQKQEESKNQRKSSASFLTCLRMITTRHLRSVKRKPTLQLELGIITQKAICSVLRDSRRHSPT